MLHASRPWNENTLQIQVMKWNTFYVSERAGKGLFRALTRVTNQAHAWAANRRFEELVMQMSEQMPEEGAPTGSSRRQVLKAAVGLAGAAAFSEQLLSPSPASAATI